MTKFKIRAALICAVMLCVCSCNNPQPTIDRSARPNILLIISDDQRYDTMQFMPLTQARIFDQGVMFSKAYVTTPLCCPSRSSILTGLYAHHHGVWINEWPLQHATIVEDLHDAGYFTGVVGKYLNSYPDKITDPPLSEFDYWAAHGSLSTDDYYNYELNVQGEIIRSEEYLTFITRDYALKFLDQAEEANKPFMLLLAFHAPHAPATPAPGDDALYPDLPPYRPPSFNIGGDRPFHEDKIASIDELHLKMAQALHSLDQSINAMLDKLDQQGKLDNTLIIYMSDNGIFWGEHQLRGKDRLYEEAVHVPFAIRYPPLIPTAAVEDRLVANIDLAPTLYDLLGLHPDWEMDGTSLIPLLIHQDVQWRDSVLMESLDVDDGFLSIGVHSERYAYIETYSQGNTGESGYQLYDLNDDPYQINNLVDDPAFAGELATLRGKLPSDRPTWPKPPQP